jgi:hypothetical protein
MKLICATLLLFAWSAVAVPKPADKSEKVDIAVAPSSPIVIDADLNLQKSVIRAPWFATSINLTNNSDEPVTVMEVQYKVTDANSPKFPRIISVSPSIYNFTEACSGGGTQKVNFTDFGVYEPGQTSLLTLTYRGVLGTGCPSVPLLNPNIYASDAAVEGEHELNVEMHLIGWFGTLSEPTTRFEKVINFKTN